MYARLNKKLFSSLIITKHIRFKSKSSAEYCLDSVRQHDYENFVCLLLLANSSRSTALAVRSFNVEVSKVSEQVSQETIGQMRLQFWQDTVDKCYLKDFSQVPKHPVATELFKAITANKLTKRYFNNLVLARKNCLKTRIFPDLESLEKYVELSVSNVYYLMLEGSGVRNVHADHAASHLGKAQGLVQQLRSTYLAKKLNVVPIPQDILVKNNVSHEEVLRGTPSERLNECAFEIASRAFKHLTTARNLLDNVPNEAKGVLLAAVPINDYLETLQRVNYDVLHPKLQKKSRLWIARLWFKHITRKY